MWLLSRWAAACVLRELRCAIAPRSVLQLRGCIATTCLHAVTKRLQHRWCQHLAKAPGISHQGFPINQSIIVIALGCQQSVGDEYVHAICQPIIKEPKFCLLMRNLQRGSPKLPRNSQLCMVGHGNIDSTFCSSLHWVSPAQCKRVAESLRNWKKVDE
jgi:hypothetical protein